MKTIAFFNNKGGEGGTTLAYHFAYMLAEMGYKTLACDLDPQANLTSMFLSDDRLIEIIADESTRSTIYKSIRPLIQGIGDIEPAHIEFISHNIGLIPGDLELSLFEDKLSENWRKCNDRDEAAFRVVSSFYRIIKEAGERFNADFNIIDVGPNFGAINRTSLIGADYLIIPMVADLFSLQGLKNLGSSLNNWRKQWEDRMVRNPDPMLELPKAKMIPLGYVLIQHGFRANHATRLYISWVSKIPQIFQQYVLENTLADDLTIDNDPYCLAILKHYYSLLSMAMAARKPIFLLKPADGAIGAHQGAVKKAYEDFRELTDKIISTIEYTEKSMT